MKRKKENKTKQQETPEKNLTETKTVPVPELAIKLLSGFLAAILVIALTLYVIGKMPSRGFWVLATMIAVIAFGILPVMRKKFAST